MKSALMIIDLQNAYCTSENKDSMYSACTTINKAIDLFRRSNQPIIWVQHINEDDGSVPGNPGFNYIEPLKPNINDYYVYKRYRNSFNKTNCLDIIRKEQIDTVIISGFSAAYCIHGTIIGALDNDLKPLLLINGIASDFSEHIKVVEQTNQVISLNELGELMNR